MPRASRAPGPPPPGQCGQDKELCAARAVPPGRGLQLPPPGGAGQAAGVYKPPPPRRCGFAAAPLAVRAGLFVLLFTAPCPGGAGPTPLGPRRGRRERLREATPALAHCHLPLSPPGPGRERLGGSWEEGCAAHRKKGVQASAVPHPHPSMPAPGLMPPREKQLPPRPIMPTQPGWPRSAFGRTQNGFGEDLWDSLG